MYVWGSLNDLLVDFLLEGIIGFSVGLGLSAGGCSGPR